jgi:dTDP-4-amino-4,6-dideoxygalactose transaminase
LMLPESPPGSLSMQASCNPNPRNGTTVRASNTHLMSEEAAEPAVLKTSLKELAIFGGTPQFAEKLHVGRPNVGNRHRLFERINDILDRRWLTNNGLYVRELEDKLAQYIGVKHCIAVCNGTVALELASRALELASEVIVPSFTFVATAHALQWQEITPVFADVNPRTHTVDPVQVERMITPKTTGIIGVHLWGKGCDVEGLKDVAERRKLKLMFDAAHAFGCSHNGRMIGGFGNAEVFSFHATKFFNTFEGGAITTNDDALASKLRLMKNFGFSGLDNVIYIGTNGKMSEVSAAMGLTLLEELDDLIAVNRGNYDQYVEELGGLSGLQLLTHAGEEKSNYQYIVVEVDQAAAGINRDAMVEILRAENILARRYFHPCCHRMEPYRSSYPHAGLMLPETERLSERVMLLPTGSAVRASDIRAICNLIRFVHERASEITARL